VKSRRKEVFLTTKIKARKRDDALREFEESLKCLQTDHVDLVQIHSLMDLAEVDQLGKPDSVLAAVQQLKTQKMARFVGITCHNDGTAMAEALRRFDFDTALMALNAAQSSNPMALRKMARLPAFEQDALPLAVQKKMGIIAMKAMAQGQIVGTGPGRASAAELLQFNLSLPVSTVVIGYENVAVLEENIRTAANFRTFDPGAMQKIREKVAASQVKWQSFLRTHDDRIVT
jgi:predicted aldo/keto reductase-like oxidoreductase